MSETTATAEPITPEVSAEASAAASVEATRGLPSSLFRGDTAAPKGTTDAGKTVQPGAEGEKTAEAEPKVALTPVEEAVAADRKALLGELATRYDLEGDFSSPDEFYQALDARERSRRDDAVTADTEAYYGELARNLPAALKAVIIDTGYVDSEGNPVRATLSDKQIQDAAFPLLNDFRGKVRAIEQQANFDELGEAALAAIPEAGHEAFLKEIADKRGLADWLPAVIEAAAQNSKAWKKRERDFEADKKKFGAEQWELGNKAPLGQASQSSGTAGGSARGVPTWAQIQKMSDSQIAALPADVWEKAKAAG